jgi:peptidoglycan/xylan/chitin deacetylase (PgdA/CDA1 family)
LDTSMKRKMKGIALETARISALMGADPVTKGVLGRLNIEYDPASHPTAYPRGAKAAACVSVDFDVTVDSRSSANHAGTVQLLELSETHDVPLTWAICGMTADADREAYRRIVSSSVKQEIGIHTYSHIDAQKSDALDFENDIVKCVKSLGLTSAPRTFVFPWNRENHFDVLRKMGFRTYRGKDRVVGPPARSNGLWNIRPVYYVDQKSRGAESLMVKYAKLCAKTHSVFHLWTHPWSLVIDGDVAPMARTLDPVFKQLKEMNEAGTLALCTMGELAEHFESTDSKLTQRRRS